MGMTDTVHSLSWFITALLTFLWIAISATFIAHISFFPATNIGLLFLYFLLFSLSEINLAILMSVCFSNARLAAIVAPVLLFLAVLPKYIFFGSNADEAAAAKYGASLLSPAAFAFGADILVNYENR